MLSTLHVMRQQLQLHVGWHVPLPQRRMQGQGLNCISRVIISLEMDHDKNECLGPCAVMNYSSFLCSTYPHTFHVDFLLCSSFLGHNTYFCLFMLVSLPACVHLHSHTHAVTYYENKSYFMHACSLQPIQYNAIQEDTVNYD